MSARLATALALLLASACAGEESEAAPDDAEPDLVVVLDEMSYDPPVLEVPAGEAVVVELVNEGNLRHDLVLPDGTESPTVQPGQSELVEVGPLETSVTGWCSIPGHREQGMELEVEVVD